MNAERLHSIAIAIREDINNTESVTLLTNLVNALQNRINQPQQPQFQTQVSTILDQLTKKLESAKSNEFTPLWQQTIEELGFQELLGIELAEQLREIFEHNQITPNTALEQIKEIQNELNPKKAAIDKLVESFQALEIGSEQLAEGECELGVLVPREYVDNKLSSLAKEFKELQDIFSAFEEVVTGSRAGLTVNSISSSDFGIYVAMTPPIAACVAHAVERVVSLYKQMLEIKKLRGELDKQQLPETILKDIETHVNQIMEAGIEKAAAEIVARTHKKLDSGRRNELELELKIAMNKIANRIDRGFNIEIRVGPHAEEDDVEEPTDDAPNPYVEIAQASEQMKFIKKDGKPILSLPESKDKKAKDQPTKSKK